MLASALALLALASAATSSPVIDVRAAPSTLLRTRQSTTSPTVDVRNGTLQGRYEPGFDQDIFLNIPYAAPPTGDLRLANPTPAVGWNDTRDATSWGNVCPGSGISSTPNATLAQNYVLDEDCLNINIIRPSGVAEGDDLPVLFWIYGGGFVQGTANDPRYNGSYLVQRSVETGQPIIFASINYRLGAFGFPAGESAANTDSLNLGIKDQRRALHWVQENIAAFGGAPDKVTIWGQSAGGMSVTLQLLAYRGRNDGLFRGAFIDSGIFAYQNNTLDSQQAGWASFLTATGCTDNDDELSCLRAVPYADYYSAWLNSSFNPTPFPDGKLIYQQNILAIQAGEVATVPVVIGATRDEATCGFGNVFKGNSNNSLDGLLAVYPDDNEIGCPFGTGDGVVSTGLQDKRSNAMWTDGVHAGSRYFAQQFSWKAPVWSWRFHQVPQNSTIDQGSAHANELPYIFRVLERTPRTPLGNRPGDLDLSLKMQDYWINFVNHLSPNKGSTPAVYWPTYDKSSQNLIFQNNETRVEKDDYRKEAQAYQIKLALGQA
ncbi:hypothetical protein JCM8097_003240 [Rhodosporidiobolus ruineniae]